MTLPLILASTSAARASLLREAGVVFETRPAGVDEASVKAAVIADGADGADARDVADALAELKARRISSRLPEHLVLGADQTLVCDGRLYDKPNSLEEAREHLLALRGRTHELHSAAVICVAGAPVWRHVGRAQLAVRPFSDAFLERYLAEQGETLLSTVGGYRLEERGAQLFSRVQGDYFSVLGLPLLELLGFLRARGVCQE